MSLFLAGIKIISITTICSAIITPIAISLKSSSSLISLEKEKDYRNNCQLVVMNSDNNLGVIACPIYKDSNKTIFYLYEKGATQPFSEIDSWVFNSNSSAQLTVTKTGDKTTKPIIITHNQRWDSLNGKALEEICTINWWASKEETNKVMSCKDSNTPWTLQAWKVADPTNLQHS